MPKIGRPRAEVVVTDDEREALVRLTKRARVNRAVAFRARIVLACLDDTAGRILERYSGFDGMPHFLGVQARTLGPGERARRPIPVGSRSESEDFGSDGPFNRRTRLASQLP